MFKFLTKDYFKEFRIRKTKIHLEYRKSAEAGMKYLFPGIAYTRRPKICFAVVVYVWNRRMLFRLVFDSKRAAPRFLFNSDKRKC